MANFWFNDVKRALLSKELDFRTPGDDVRVMLLMDNTTAASSRNANFISDIATLDQYNGTPYAVQTLTGKVISENAGANRAEFDANDPVWANLGQTTPGSRPIAGALVYKHDPSGLNTAHVPLLWFDDGGFPFTPTGANVTIQWNAGGIGQVT